MSQPASTDRVAVTGGSGRLGQEVLRQLLQAGYPVRSLDRAPLAAALTHPGDLQQTHTDLVDLGSTIEALRGCQALIHLAAFPGPFGHPPGAVYANNTIASYNVLHAAALLGIRRVCLASSINALGGIGSERGHFDYFPVDERHPSYHADDYSLSKWVMEAQADSFARRCPEMTLSSLRLHALPDEPPELQDALDGPEAPIARGLWGYTLLREGARACLLAVQARFEGHEVFFITAPRTCSIHPSLELARRAYPNVPLRGELPGRASFYDCTKAARLLGWVHQEVP